MHPDLLPYPREALMISSEHYVLFPLNPPKVLGPLVIERTDTEAILQINERAFWPSTEHAVLVFLTLLNRW